MVAWPPERAEAVDTAGMYDRLAAVGYGYGPAFRGLQAAWRHGDELFAEVACPTPTTARGTALTCTPPSRRRTAHPALDAVEASGAIVLPFAWTAVTRYAAVGRLSAARVRIRRAGRDAMSVLVTDDTGAPILSAGSLALRPTSADQLAESVDAAAEWLHRVEWAPMTLPDGEAGTGRWAVLADQPA